MAKPRYYIGNCVSNPFDTVDELVSVIDDADQVSVQVFTDNVCVTDVMVYGVPFDEAVELFPADYTFHYNAVVDVWFFTHSCIEYFFR